MKKKYNFTLIEILISLGLLSIIITLLFGYFVKITKIENKINTIKKETLDKNFLYARLSYIFTELKTNQSDDNAFYTKGKEGSFPSLYVIFDNQTDFDPNFSNLINGKIFIDDKKNLILKMFSKDFKHERKELLLENVDSIKYKFLSLKNSDLKECEIEKINNTIAWYSIWPEKINDLPSIIKIIINEDIEFSFFIPSKSIKILYHKALL